MKYSESLKSALRALDESHAANRKRLVESAAAFEAADRVVALVKEMVEGEPNPPFRNPRVLGWMAWRSPVIRVEVESFRETQPLLDFVEGQGYEFTGTRDWPAGNERTYDAFPPGADSNTPGITVEAHLIGEGKAGCKRVITGYRTPDPEPIYGFDCGDPGIDAPPLDSES